VFPCRNFGEMSVGEIPGDQRAGRRVRFEDDFGKIATDAIYGFAGSAGDPKKRAEEYFRAAVFAAILREGIEVLIIDVRNNGGGRNATRQCRLFSFLWGRTRSVYYNDGDHCRSLRFQPYMTMPRAIFSGGGGTLGRRKIPRVKHPTGARNRPASRIRREGPDLINGGSFSTTCEFTSTVHFPQAREVYRRGGGRSYYGNTSVSAPESCCRTRSCRYPSLYKPITCRSAAMSAPTERDAGLSGRETIQDVLWGRTRRWKWPPLAGARVVSAHRLKIRRRLKTCRPDHRPRKNSIPASRSSKQGPLPRASAPSCAPGARVRRVSAHSHRVLGESTITPRSTLPEQHL